MVLYLDFGFLGNSPNSCPLSLFLRCWVLSLVTVTVSVCFRASLDKKLAASVNILPKASSL